jgi:hypothetical protein
MDINWDPAVPGFGQPSVAVDAAGVPVSNPPLGAAATIPTPFYLQTPISVVAKVTAPVNACALQFTGATFASPAGSSATLTAPTTPQPIVDGSTLDFSFTPDVGDVAAVPGNYTINAQLNDGGSPLLAPLSTIDVGGACGANVPTAAFAEDGSFLGPFSPDTVGADVSATFDGSPSAGLPVGTTPTGSPDAVALSFAGSSATGCGLLKNLSYHWSINTTGNPANASLSSTDTATTELTATTPGDVITVKLFVDDGTEESVLFSHALTVVPSVSTTVDDAGTTAPWTGSETAGASAYDTMTWASYSGTSTQSLSVTYEFFDNGSCSGNLTLLNTVTLDAQGNAPPSTTESNLGAGSYSFQAVDADGNPISDCESFDVAVTPTLVTTAGGPVSLAAGDPLFDTATLSGGNSPTGSITFYLFAPGVTPSADDSNNVFSEIVPVNGNGGYGTSGYPPTETGAYQWVAVYSGDVGNAPVASTFGHDPEFVIP